MLTEIKYISYVISFLTLEHQNLFDITKTFCRVNIYDDHKAHYRVRSEKFLNDLFDIARYKLASLVIHYRIFRLLRILTWHFLQQLFVLILNK